MYKLKLSTPNEILNEKKEYALTCCVKSLRERASEKTLKFIFNPFVFFSPETFIKTLNPLLYTTIICYSLNPPIFMHNSVLTFDMGFSPNNNSLQSAGLK